MQIPSLQEIFDRLLARYGEQRWWPADTPFEVMIGAVLTQATSWTNVELAIARLKDAGALSPSAIRDMDAAELAALIYSSGFHNIKARRLKALAKFIGDAYGDNIGAMRAADCDTLRRELLAVSGIGEETADAILLYALDKPVFVVDAYSRRLTERLGIAPKSQSYGAHQQFVHRQPATRHRAVRGQPAARQRAVRGQPAARYCAVRGVSCSHRGTRQASVPKDARVRRLLPSRCVRDRDGVE